jgi:hypothetical protein
MEMQSPNVVFKQTEQKQTITTWAMWLWLLLVRLLWLWLEQCIIKANRLSSGPNAVVTGTADASAAALPAWGSCQDCHQTVKLLAPCAQIKSMVTLVSPSRHQ